MCDKDSKTTLYRESLKMYGSMISELADAPDYVRRLIYGEELTAMEAALRNHIEHAYNEK